jgi:hypothetical protein
MKHAPKLRGVLNLTYHDTLHRIWLLVLNQGIHALVPFRPQVLVPPLSTNLHGVAIIQIGNQKRERACGPNISGALEDTVPKVLRPRESSLQRIELEESRLTSAMSNIRMALGTDARQE